MQRGFATVQGAREAADVSRFETKSSGRFSYEDQSAMAVNAFSHVKDTNGAQCQE